MNSEPSYSRYMPFSLAAVCNYSLKIAVVIGMTCAVHWTSPKIAVCIVYSIAALVFMLIM